MRHAGRFRRMAGLAAALAGLAGCTADPTPQLEKVAKDWALTIRASQVIPVYPLSEDIQPGDVFLVPTPISDQATVYADKGFLPTDQLVVRMQGLDFKEFYKDSFWKGSYGATPNSRPVPGSPVLAPRVAFPTYSFIVDQGAGLKLALPVQGVPVGLGLMGASRAAGTITISDSYTYGVDGASLFAKLREWYDRSPGVKATFTAMVGSANAPIYLRVVNRVFLTKAVDVSLANLGSTSGGVDAGAAQGIKLPDLSSDDPAKVKSAALAYKNALDALSSALNVNAGSAPGGSIRFAQVSRRTVSLKETFDRPLVIGFLGFDVKVFRDGSLSAPIPSFAVLKGETQDEAFRAALDWCPSDDLAARYMAWLRSTQGAGNNANFQAVEDWLQRRGMTDVNPIDLRNDCKRRRLLEDAQARFLF